MARLLPVPVDGAPENVAQQYERVQELFGDNPIPAPFLVYGNVAPFLKDFYMNFKKFVFTDGHLDAKTKAAVGLVVSAHAKCGAWLDYFDQRCQQLGFTEEQIAEILAVSATNYMYNTFFKFRDLSGSALFEGMGVGLRASTFAGTSLDSKLVELIDIVISDLNACKPCTSGHVTKARELGITSEQILEAIQCAATMYVGAQFLNSASS
ncbi:carboxymuconolactone decarboxylase family protein [Planctomicrobium sp. SH668]|uniref:carboxymuconolactone decarboxylase family protein n=1 Tax=Planctomicrobium sp. SH668 TaxID=3448126 RepID=UPI003F5CB6EE